MVSFEALLNSSVSLKWFTFYHESIVISYKQVYSNTDVNF